MTSTARHKIRNGSKSRIFIARGPGVRDGDRLAFDPSSKLLLVTAEHRWRESDTPAGRQGGCGTGILGYRAGNWVGGTRQPVDGGSESPSGDERAGIRHDDQVRR